MKKLFVLLLSLIMICTLLVSCGNESEPAVNETESDTAATSPESESADATESAVETEPVVVLPDYLNPLTGLSADKDLYSERPVAIMLNNLWSALPQHGISDCEIIYECLVEGGITRLMAVTSDYEKIGVLGSIRSCRHYYLDLAKNYDAIYVHAGGSDQGYIEIRNRDVDNLDGVNMYFPDMFYRDKDRLNSGYGYEHTLMTTGEKIAGGIAYKKYRTELSDEFKNKDAFNFVEYGKARELEGDNAGCVLLPYSKYQTARFDYDIGTNSYYRFQFEDVPHIDGTTGGQISFTNVLILFCKVVDLGDSYGHLDITTENTSGEGYYIYGGKCEPITWSKPTEDSPTTYYGADGEELVVNRGKTFISIFPEGKKQNIDFNYIPPTGE